MAYFAWKSAKNVIYYYKLIIYKNPSYGKDDEWQMGYDVYATYEVVRDGRVSVVEASGTIKNFLEIESILLRMKDLIRNSCLDNAIIELRSLLINDVEYKPLEDVWCTVFI